MSKRYRLRIPDGCEVESVNSTTLNGQDAILVLLAPVFNPRQGEYVATEDGQVGIMTANGIWKFHDNIYPFDRYANEEQRDEFNKLLTDEGLHYNSLTQSVERRFSDGDIITAVEDSCKWIMIYKSRAEDEHFNYHSMLSVNCMEMMYNDKCLSSGFMYATDAEKNLLFDAMKKDGKFWDAERKKIVKSPKVGDLCIFWNNRKQYADVGILYGFKEERPVNHRNCVYKNCIRFEGEEQFKKFIKSKQL